jgi:hypothetical protein
MFRKVMIVLESHYFHHAMWNFAMNLFDRRVFRWIVLEEDMSGAGAGEDPNMEDVDVESNFGLASGGDFGSASHEEPANGIGEAL